MRLRRDLLVALMGFGVVFALVYVMGRAFLPSSDLTESVAQSADTEHVLLDELRADLADRVDTAVIEVSGAMAGRSVLSHADSPFLWVPQGTPPEEHRPGGPVDLDVRYAGGGVTLAIKADQMEEGQARSERLTIVLNMGRRSFNAHPGECTLELTRSGSVLDPTPTGAVGLLLAWPYFAGHMTCREIADIRSGDTVSFTAVFTYGDV